MRFILLMAAFFVTVQLDAQEKFAQLGSELPSPNSYRTASGAPGHAYWQQKGDYKMSITLDDTSQKIYGEEEITYTNNSPDVLNYLWLQLDQNMRSKDSDTHRLKSGSMDDKVSDRFINGLNPDFDGGFKIEYVKDKGGQPLKYVINKTMMKVTPTSPLKSGAN